MAGRKARPRISGGTDSDQLDVALCFLTDIRHSHLGLRSGLGTHALCEARISRHGADLLGVRSGTVPRELAHRAAAHTCRRSRDAPAAVPRGGGITGMNSPRITHLAWGEIEAEGLARARDLKLWPGSGRPWDWRETGTHHVPGIQVADVQERLENGARTVVRTAGSHIVRQHC